jgi:hypothetical protein
LHPILSNPAKQPWQATNRILNPKQKMINRMKTQIRMAAQALALALIAAGCASVSPAGNWNYTISGTPQGDFTGTLEVAKSNGGYTASVKAPDSEMKFEQFTFDKKTARSAGNFYFQNMSVNFDAEVTKATMDGSVSVQGMSFPFKATRKK